MRSVTGVLLVCEKCEVTMSRLISINDDDMTPATLSITTLLALSWWRWNMAHGLSLFEFWRVKIISGPSQQMVLVCDQYKLTRGRIHKDSVTWLFVPVTKLNTDPTQMNDLPLEISKLWHGEQWDCKNEFVRTNMCWNSCWSWTVCFYPLKIFDCSLDKEDPDSMT